MKTLLILGVMAGLAAGRQDEKKGADLEAVIVDLTGTVDVKRPGDKDWVAAEKNMKLGKGSEICTAEASTATLLFQPNLTITVKAITMTKIDDLAKTEKGIKTDVRLKFGSVNVELKKGEIESSLKVATPNATTSVSGSTGDLYSWASDGGGFLNLNVTTGNWNQENGGGSQSYGPGGVANDNGDLFNQIEWNFDSDQYRNYFGRSEGELYGQTDPTGGTNPTYEGGSPGLNPFADVFTQPSALPAPPGTP